MSRIFAGFVTHLPLGLRTAPIAVNHSLRSLSPCPLIQTRTKPVPRRVNMTSAGAPTIPASLPPSLVGVVPVYAQCMLRINDPNASIDFYTTLGMKPLTRLDFPKFSFSLIFFAYTQVTPPSQDLPQEDRAAWLWSCQEPTIELTWNWPPGATTYDEAIQQHGKPKTSPEEIYLNGNEADAPKGFGYIQITLSNVAAALNHLRTSPSPPRVVDELTPLNSNYKLVYATVADPDGYHVRLVGKTITETTAQPLSLLDPVFSSVMLRVHDVAKAVSFFGQLGFHVVSSVDDATSRTTCVCMAYVTKQTDEDDATNLRACTLTLSQAWDALGEDALTNGNVKPYRGFGHVGIVVDDVYESMGALENAGHKIVRKASPFADVGSIGFVAEPSTDYWVEVINRAGDTPSQPYVQP